MRSHALVGVDAVSEPMSEPVRLRLTVKRNAFGKVLKQQAGEGGTNNSSLTLRVTIKSTNPFKSRGNAQFGLLQSEPLRATAEGSSHS